jgi:hypothetical protein
MSITDTTFEYTTNNSIYTLEMIGQLHVPAIYTTENSTVCCIGEAERK